MTAREDAVEEDGVFGGVDAGHDRRVVRPGDGGVRDAKPFGDGALGGEPADRRDGGGGIVQEVRREAVDRDDDDVVFGGAGGAADDMKEEGQQQQHWEQSIPHYSVLLMV